MVKSGGSGGNREVRFDWLRTVSDLMVLASETFKLSHLSSQVDAFGIRWPWGQGVNAGIKGTELRIRADVTFDIKTMVMD